VGWRYPVDAWRKAIARAVAHARTACATALMMDFKWVGIDEDALPTALRDARRNKVNALVMVWVIGNVIVANLGNTGAFEVFYDGEAAFSKLASGKPPSLEAIFAGINAIRGR